MSVAYITTMINKELKGMDLMVQIVKENLNEVVNYNEMTSNELKKFKTILKTRISELDQSQTTAAGMKVWLEAVERDLQAFKETMGLPEYSEGQRGDMPQLVHTPLNIMKDFVYKKMNSCVYTARDIKTQRTKVEDLVTKRKKVEESEHLRHAGNRDGHTVDLQALLYRMKQINI